MMQALQLAVASFAMLSSFEATAFGGWDAPGDKINCRPTSTDATAEIQSCLDTKRVVTLPSGTFQISGNPALTVSTDFGVLQGMGALNTTLLLSDRVGGYSESRMVVVTGSGVTIDRLTIDGGMGDLTCAAVKSPNGQQQHAIFLSGTAAPVVGFNFGSGLVVQKVSGDALFMYNEVNNVSIRDRTVSGFCRSGITMNSYTLNGMDTILIEDVNLVPSAVAQSSVRGIDLEPNAYMSNITINRVTANRIEAGRINGLTVNGVEIKAVNGAPAAGINLTSINVGTISNSVIGNTVVGAHTVFLNKSNDLVLSDLVITQGDPAGHAILGTSSGSSLIGPLTFDGIIATSAQSSAIRIEIADVSVTVRNSTLAGDYPFFIHGQGALTIEDTDLTGAIAAVWIRPVTGLMTDVSLFRLSGAAPTAVALSSSVDSFQFCDSTLTGTAPASDACP